MLVVAGKTIAEAYEEDGTLRYKAVQVNDNYVRILTFNSQGQLLKMAPERPRIEVYELIWAGKEWW